MENFEDFLSHLNTFIQLFPIRKMPPIIVDLSYFGCLWIQEIGVLYYKLILFLYGKSIND